MTNYERIEQAIHFLRNHYQDQPSLDEIAQQVFLSPFHFQRMFTEWAGVSPKKFLQFLTIEHAKKILANKPPSLLDTTFETGLSSSGRLHDLFIQIEGMTPGEYKNAGEDLNIRYQYYETIFGEILIASTPKGICFLEFITDKTMAFATLKSTFRKATFIQQKDTNQSNALLLFQKDWSNLSQIKLHLKGTDFQLKVWKALLTIPSGNLSSYGSLAQQINHPRASRAVGSAIGDNPVAYLIPCHRVIKSTGEFGQYHWGANRKSLLIGWEAVN